MNKYGRERKKYLYITSFVVGIILITAAVFVWNNYNRNRLVSQNPANNEIIYSGIDNLEDALKKDPNNSGLLIAASEQLIETRDFDRADRHLKKVIRLHPGKFDEARARILLVRKDIWKMQDFKQMENFYFPKMPEEDDKRLKEASKLLEGATGKTEDIQRQRYLIAEFYWDSRMFEPAIAEMKKAIALAPESVEGLEARVLLAHMSGSQGDKSRFLPEIDNIARLLDNNNYSEKLRLYYLVGQAYFDLGYPDRAVPVLQKMVSTWPETDYALMGRLYLAWIMGRKGEDQKAVAYLKDVITTMKSLLDKNSEMKDNVMYAMLLGSSGSVKEFLKKSDISPEEINRRVEKATTDLKQDKKREALDELEKLMNSISL